MQLVILFCEMSIILCLSSACLTAVCYASVDLFSVSSLLPDLNSNVLYFNMVIFSSYLSLSFLAVKRHLDQGDLDKGKYLVVPGLQFQRFRHRASKTTHTVIHFLQQGHTYSKKATSPNSLYFL